MVDAASYVPHREAPRRTCAHRGCKTILTSANPDANCVLHGGFRPELTTDSSHDVHDDRAELWAELMEAA